MIEKGCEHCGKTFSVHISRAKYGRGLHCSRACQYAARRAAPNTSLTFVCAHCAKPFSKCPSTVASKKGAGKYCSRECRDLHWKGSNTPNWQNGQGVYKRGPNWFSTRRRIIARDKVCQRCGVSGNLHVHHMTPFRCFDDPNTANADSNLVALCPPCHRREDATRKWVKIESGAILSFSAGGAAWQMAREQGLV